MGRRRGREREGRELELEMVFESELRFETKESMKGEALRGNEKTKETLERKPANEKRYLLSEN